MTQRFAAGRSLRIDGDRLLSDLNILRRFGAQETGVVRQSYSAPDQASRRWLAEQMIAIGLNTAIDGVGNVIGLSRQPGPAVLMGSHTDTQARGGWLDGTLGVMYALEIARSLVEQYAGTQTPALDIASWIDEEGTYLNFLGSRSFCGAVTEAELDAAKSASGKPLKAAIAEAGYGGRPRIQADSARYLGYFEAHIEQGGRLEAARKRIGVVTAIVGAREYLLEFSGEPNHAGTTPMTLRKDAALELFRLAVELDKAFRAVCDEFSVWTFGRALIEPNAASIIPGKAYLHVQFRDPREAILDELGRLLQDGVALGSQTSGVEVRIVREIVRLSPTPLDTELQDRVREAARSLAPGSWMDVTSGAGHDAQILRRLMPAAMLFIPSLGGISHSFAEDSRAEDIVLGCEVAADVVARLLLR